MPRLRRRALNRRASDDPLGAILAGAHGSERVLRFFRKCLIHGKGEWAGKPVDPLPFQEEIIRGLYDPTTQTGHRRIRNGLVFIPRKNGKTSLSAGLGLYETFCCGQGARVVCAANSRDQASELFSVAADMVDASDVLRARAVVSRATKKITDRVSKSTFRAISADATTTHGMDLTCWIYDELHGAPGRELFDVLNTSTGARREALGLVLSTSGFEKLSILGEVYDYAKRVLADPSIDPSFYAYVAEADEASAWDDEQTWFKANPALGVFRNLDEMRIAADRARQIPGLVDAFRRLYLNQWTSAESRWLDMAEWDKCGDHIEIEDGALCYGGLDLSSTIDLTAFVLTFPVGDRLVVRPWFWIPEENMREREKRDRVPYRQWVKDGLVEATPGNVIDYRCVTKRIIELSQRYKIRELAFDRWGSAQVVQELSDAGVEVVEIGQGYASLSAPTKRLQELVLTGTLAHGGNQVLRWNADCATTMSDPAGNIKLVKSDRLRSTRRIDGLYATVFSVARWMHATPEVECSFAWI